MPIIDADDEVAQAQSRVDEWTTRRRLLRQEVTTVDRELASARRGLAAARNRLRRQNRHGIVINIQGAPPANPPVNPVPAGAPAVVPAPAPVPAVPAGAAGGEDDLMNDGDDEGDVGYGFNIHANI
jgi:hypothetical protein